MWGTKKYINQVVAKWCLNLVQFRTVCNSKANMLLFIIVSFSNQ